jgi:predicted oxidoreductase
MNLPDVVAGLWRLHEWDLALPVRVRWIEQALEVGVDTFDHADIYGGYSVEALFGEALAAAPGLRGRLRIVTKCGIRLVAPARPAHGVKHYDSSRGHIVASVESSLAALRTDRIDMLLVHRPDWLAHPDEVASAFDALRRAGKVLAFGVSNHTPRQLEMLHRRLPLATHQFEFSALQMQALADGRLEQCVDLGLRPMLWSPLGGGRLFRGADAQALRVRAVLAAIGARLGVAPASVAYAWLMRHPARPVPVTGTQRIDGLREALSARTLELSREDWTRIWQASMGHEVP